jgi:putative phosphoribosyl transferase
MALSAPGSAKRLSALRSSAGLGLHADWEGDNMATRVGEHLVEVRAGDLSLEGSLFVPEAALGVVLFAHGSGSSRHSPRNTFVAHVLQRAGIGTLLLDLLTPQEDDVRGMRFDIDLLTERLIGAAGWLRAQREGRDLRLGFFGASTGAAAALDAAATPDSGVAAVVSRGGRPDLATRLAEVTAPTLLIVGGLDGDVLRLNREALERLRCEKALTIVPGATHLFEEPGTLDQVAHLAAGWFVRHFEPED